MFNLYMQMLSVYRDPEGTHCTEDGNSFQIANRFVTSEDEGNYKRTIQGLNEEIKDLNHELQMVRIITTYVRMLL